MILSTLSFQTRSLGSSSFWPPQLTAQMGNPRPGEVLFMRPGSACPSSAHTPATAPQEKAQLWLSIQGPARVWQDPFFSIFA